MPFGEDLALGVIPSIGSLGAAALQRNWALKDWNRVNEYNHPKNQVKRNTEAGLPLAAMFARGGSTSSDVRSTQVDPTLGTGKGLEAFMQSRMQKKQLELLESQIRTEQARGEVEWKNAGLKANELTLSNDALAYQINAEGKNTVAPAYQPPSNQVQSLVLDKRAKEAETKTKEVIADLQRAKTVADIEHVLATIGLSKQQYAYNTIMQNVDKILLKNLDNPENNWLQALVFKWFLKK